MEMETAVGAMYNSFSSGYADSYLHVGSVCRLLYRTSVDTLDVGDFYDYFEMLHYMD
jgi:hypothetical protein